MLNSRPFAIIVLLALSAVLYTTLLKDWFQPAPIQIVVQNRRPLSKNDPDLPAISFKFQKDYRLTGVKVLAVDEWTANKDAAPYWHLRGDSASPPTNFVLYGFALPGMETRTEPLPLDPGTTYRILVEAGRHSGSIDFQL